MPEEPRRIAEVVVLALGLAASGCSRAAPAGQPAVRTSETALVSTAPTVAAAAEDAPEESGASPEPVPPRSPFAYANVEPDDDLVVAPPEPRADCYDALDAAGVRYRKATLAVHREGKTPKKPGILCGAEQVVVYLGSAAKIAYAPGPPLVTCTMALALARVDTLVQEEAARHLGQPITRIKHIGTYSCREMAAYPGWVSEHSYANAIDLEVFTRKDGKSFSVLSSFEQAPETKTREGAFLRSLSRRLYDEDVFSTVLTPFFNAHHKNHFHLDLARYRTDGTRGSTDASAQRAAARRPRGSRARRSGENSAPRADNRG